MRVLFLKSSITARSAYRYFAPVLMLFFACLPLHAVGDVCSTPVIETSSGDELFFPGVSTATISAADGELISYTTDGTDPSTGIADATEGPVTITLTKSMLTIRAVAVAESKEPGTVASLDLFPVKTATTYKTFSQMFVAKKTGALGGPFLIYALERTVKGGCWMVLCDPEAPESPSSMVIELPSAPQGLNVGETIDYVDIKGYESGGMRKITSSALPVKSNPCPSGLPGPEILSAPPQYWEDYYRTPIMLPNVTIENGMAYDLLLPDKFADIRPDLQEGMRYNLHGIIGSDAADNHFAFRFFILGYEAVTPETPAVTSVSEAFDIEGDSRDAVMDCDLTVITFNRERSHLFAADSNGDDIVITGDFSDSDLWPGDIIRGFKARLTRPGGVRTADTEDGIICTGSGNEAEPIDISVDDLASYPGRHVRFECIIGRDPQPATRAGSLQNINVGGFTVNPSAISDGTAETIGYAVNEYDPDDTFRFRGMLMPDSRGDMEFWPIEVLTMSGDRPVTGIDESLADRDAIRFAGGRPVLAPGQRMCDPLGRPADPATAQSGVYIITSTSSRPVKIIIR